MKRCVLYARVSTNDQSTAMQVTALKDYIDRRGWKLAGEYIDEGISGSKERRPALDRLMADARRRRFDAVVVFRFDRFARSVSHLAKALDEFRALGIDFVSLHEAIDTSTPMGRAMFHICGAFAELEREIIRERVRAGLQNARRRGKKLGRPHVELDADRARELSEHGLSRRAIARELGVSSSTVQRLLGRAKNPIRNGSKKVGTSGAVLAA